MIEFYFDYVKNQLYEDLIKLKAETLYEDIKQELYLRYLYALNKINRYKVTNYKNYFFKVCYNLVVDLVKEDINNKKSEKKALKEYMELRQIEYYDTHFSEIKELLLSANLNTEERIIYLCISTGSTFKDIASVLNIKVDTLKKKFYRSKYKIKEVLL